MPVWYNISHQVPVGKRNFMWGNTSCTNCNVWHHKPKSEYRLSPRPTFTRVFILVNSVIFRPHSLSPCNPLEYYAYICFIAWHLNVLLTKLAVQQFQPYRRWTVKEFPLIPFRQDHVNHFCQYRFGFFKTHTHTHSHSHTHTHVHTHTHN